MPKAPSANQQTLIGIPHSEAPHLLVFPSGAGPSFQLWPGMKMPGPISQHRVILVDSGSLGRLLWASAVAEVVCKHYGTQATGPRPAKGEQLRKEVDAAAQQNALGFTKSFVAGSGPAFKYLAQKKRDGLVSALRLSQMASEEQSAVARSGAQIVQVLNVLKFLGEISAAALPLAVELRIFAAGGDAIAAINLESRINVFTKVFTFVKNIAENVDSYGRINWYHFAIAETWALAQGAAWSRVKTGANAVYWDKTINSVLKGVRQGAVALTWADARQFALQYTYGRVLSKRFSTEAGMWLGKHSGALVEGAHLCWDAHEAIKKALDANRDYGKIAAAAKPPAMWRKR